MNTIGFTETVIDWENNSPTVIPWQNNSSLAISWLSYAATNNIRYAQFVRVTTPTDVYRFATTPAPITVPEVDAQAFNAVGTLMGIGTAQQDIKSTANETSFSLVGIDTAMLGWVLGQNVKGAQIEAWNGFFNTDGVLIDAGGQGGLYQFFNGYINSFSISEQWMEEARQFVGIITVNASSTQIILQNRTAGRYTNNNSWQFFNNGDTSMDRVSFISTINYLFGKQN
tara:strand:- start:13539 stop:14219 length:681 start_codon:yes stop_codon:yes gene_type:complete